MYTVLYPAGELCNCGEYFVDNRTIADGCVSSSSNSGFSVEISVDHIRNQWGENCSFLFTFVSRHFPYDGYDVNFNLRILQVQPTGTLTIVFYFRFENCEKERGPPPPQFYSEQDL